MHAIILAGGSGTRFWPLSREGCPKQFLDLTGCGSLIRQTADRMLHMVSRSHLWIVTAEHQQVQCLAHVPDIGLSHVLCEPIARNTAAAVGLAAIALVQAHGPNTVMIVTPADHSVANHEAFTEALTEAVKRAKHHDEIVLLGIRPTRPETGYGYIERGKCRDGHVFAVKSFREKPDLPTAKRYVEKGGYAWNAGVFVMRAGIYLEEVRRQRPRLAAGLDAMAADLNNTDIRRDVYEKLENISVDHGVLEGAKALSMIEVSCGWSDVGGWPALADITPSDHDGNTVVGRTIAHDSQGNVIYASPGSVVAVIGLRDMVVVHTPEATLVMPKDRAEDVRVLHNTMERHEK